MNKQHNVHFLKEYTNGKHTANNPQAFTLFPSMKIKKKWICIILIVKSYLIFCLILTGRASGRFLLFTWNLRFQPVLSVRKSCVKFTRLETISPWLCLHRQPITEAVQIQLNKVFQADRIFPWFYLDFSPAFFLLWRDWSWFVFEYLAWGLSRQERLTKQINQSLLSREGWGSPSCPRSDCHCVLIASGRRWTPKKSFGH